MNKGFLKALQSHFKGEVRDDAPVCCAYSVDASIFEMTPLAVAMPKDREDVQEALRIARRYGVPVTARGAATGITGGCLGKGLVLDLSKHLNKILDINIEKKRVTCEPGVVQDQLNSALAPHGYRLGPDTSTGNRATIGGMLANNAAGAHSLVYGKMVDHVLAVEAVLADSSVVLLQEEGGAAPTKEIYDLTRQQSLHQSLINIRDKYREEILRRYPCIPRRASGYSLDELIKPGPPNIAKLFAGSEGTLGIATEITLNISPLLKETALCVVHFHEMADGFKAVPKMLEFHPASLEMIDDKILEAAIRSPTATSQLGWVEGSPQAVFVAEFENPDSGGKLEAFCKELKSQGIGYAHRVLATSKEMNNLWDVRKAGLGLLLSKRLYSRAIAFLEDLSIPPHELASFMARFRDYLRTCGKEAGIYGHAGSGCMHIRPYIDLREEEDLRLMQKMMEETSSLVLEHGGALSGEHGDGLIRSWLNEKMFGAKLYQAFRQIKTAFDPDNLLNPGKVVNGTPPLHDLRLSPETTIRTIDTFQDFAFEGGFALATDLCNGNALCRKREGLMCPSFQATGDEFDTTRARAQALRAVINGRWRIEDFTSDKVGSVLDLCLECKGCKKECPSSVDMAKMKAEFLYQYQEKHGYSLRGKLFGHIGTFYQFAHPMGRLFNAAAQTSFTKKALALLGIAPERQLPLLATERFSPWVKKQLSGNGQQVILFNDTFTEFNQPEVGKAAHFILSTLGYDVIIPPWTCCGRPLISKGLLKSARAKAESLIHLLYPYARQQVPIIGLEPSCILTIIDDHISIVSQEVREKARTVAKQCTTLDQFLHKLLTIGRLHLPFQNTSATALLHGHCHQKALVGMTPSLELLQAIPGLTFSEIKSGCCGMAGSFGYEAEHYGLSMQIGSLHLFPAVRNASPESVIIANGFSCRSQITQGTGRKALHLAEFLRDQCLPL